MTPPAKRNGRDGADGAPPARAKPDGFDRWVRRQLHQLYDPVANEPIPERLAELLDRFPAARERRPDDESNGGGQHG